jgi:hypothetical protein
MATVTLTDGPAARRVAHIEATDDEPNTVIWVAILDNERLVALTASTSEEDLNLAHAAGWLMYVRWGADYQWAASRTL